MGMRGTGIWYMKEPNMVRLDMEFMGMVMTQACDGETSWATDFQTGAAEAVTGEPGSVFRNSSFGNSALLNPEKYGISYVFKGKETIEGKEYLLLDRIYPDEYTITLYIDSSTYLLYKMKQRSYNEMMMEIVEESIYSDYREVEGMKAAHTITILRDGEVFAVMTVSDTKFNTGLEDSFFKMNQ